MGEVEGVVCSEKTEQVVCSEMSVPSWWIPLIKGFACSAEKHADASVDEFSLPERSLYVRLGVEGRSSLSLLSISDFSPPFAFSLRRKGVWEDVPKKFSEESRSNPGIGRFREFSRSNCWGENENKSSMLYLRLSVFVQRKFSESVSPLFFLFGVISF